MIRKTVVVVLSLAALGTGGMWAYSSWPYTPSKLILWSSLPPSTRTVRFYGSPSEWYTQGGRFVIQHRFLVDQKRRCTNAWKLGPFYFKIDIFSPSVWEHPYRARGRVPFDQTPAEEQRETLRLNEFNLACLNLHIPLWFLFGAFSGYPIVAIVRYAARRRRRRRMQGLCVHCAHDLTGNVTGVCPECGTPITSE